MIPVNGASAEALRALHNGRRLAYTTRKGVDYAAYDNSYIAKVNSLS